MSKVMSPKTPRMTHEWGENGAGTHISRRTVTKFFAYVRS